MTSVAIHVDQLFYPAPGGIGTYLRELVPALAETDPDLDVTLFHAHLPGRPEPWMSAFRREVLHGTIRRLYPGWDLAGRPLLPPELRLTDVLHAPSPAAIPPPARGQRLVVTVHDLAFRVFPQLFPPQWRLLFRAGTRRAARHADAIITVSEHTAADLMRLYGVERDRIHVTPLAASLPEQAIDPGPVLERLRIRPPYVLFVGTLEPRKNLVRLVHAYRRLARELSIRLVLAGPLGWGERSLMRAVREDGPGDIVLTGKTPPDVLDALYRGAQVFAYPSLYEGFGLPVLEAMARGVPVVASTASSLPEVAGDAALLVDPRSTLAIADGIRRLLSDEAERRRLGAAGLERAKQFSWQRTAQLTLAAYGATSGVD